jgi:hypothetical protein
MSSVWRFSKDASTATNRFIPKVAVVAEMPAVESRLDPGVDGDLGQRRREAVGTWA